MASWPVARAIVARQFFCEGTPVVIALHRWLLLLLLLLALVRPTTGGAEETTTGGAEETDDHGSESTEADTPIQVVEGRVSTSGLQLYRLTGLKEGQTLYVHAGTTAGFLDPLVFLLKPDADARALAREPLDALVRTLSRDHDPIEVTRRIFNRYALAGNDDYEGHYAAAFALEIPADGDYQLAVGSSLVRPSAGNYRLVIGIDEPDVLSGRPESRGSAFVFAEGDVGVLERAIVSVTGSLQPDQPIRFYHLADMARGQTLYAFAEALTGDLRPMLTLYDQTDKPVAYASFSATASSAALEYALPKRADGYRLGVTASGRSGAATAGDFRLMLGLNAPEVLHGEGASTGRALLKEPIPVRIGIRLEQITDVDQKAENYSVVATLLLQWTSPALAFDPETAGDRFKVYTGDAFGAEMSRRGQIWPQYALVNQQGNRWVQNRVVVIQSNGETIYLERFSTTLQAPDFDFRDFPFDAQRFFISVDLLTPEWLFQLQEIDGYSTVGDRLGEEEWVVTGYGTSLSGGEILQRPVSRFELAFEAKRHIDYYVFRILLPLVVIIPVSSEISSQNSGASR